MLWELLQVFLVALAALTIFMLVVGLVREAQQQGLAGNDGLLLPEQVWDGVGNPTRQDYRPGEGTDSATPLAWTHAEYIKLLRSLADRAVWDRYAPVERRYGQAGR